MPTASRIDRKRHTMAALVLLAALALASGPYLYGALSCPEGSRFWAVPGVNAWDANQYLGFTRIAGEGRLLVGDPFTQEPNTPRLFLPQVQFEGLLVRMFHWSPLGAFHASRVLAGAALLLAGWWFGTLFLPGWRLRRLYLGFLCFSAGAGWLADLVGFTAHGDALQPEGNTFFTLGNLPHLSLSAALLTALFATLPALERSPPSRRGRWLILALGLSALLSWTHPFDFVTLGLGLASYALARWVGERRFPVSSAAHAGAAALGALPAALYLGWILRTDPVYRALASDVLQVQPFAFYAVAHGPLLLAALPVLCRKELRSRCLLPLCWVICVFLFLFGPFRLGGKQPRLLGGVHVPLALLATVGVDLAARRLSLALRRGGLSRGTARRAGAAASLACLAVSAAGAPAAIARHAGAYVPGRLPYYQGRSVQELLAYLDREGDRSQLTLGGPFTGGWAPTWADTRVYYGHWHMTLNAPVKLRALSRFFSGTGTPEERAAWLRANHVRWVIYWPPEWEWYGARPAPLDDVPGLRPAFTAADAVLWRFEPGG